VNPNQADYDAKCLACHETAKKSDAASSKSLVAIQTCTVAKANCVSCHMPKVELPEGHAAFTDHEIRIVRADEPYPN
jgi:formate-dependent nitrite reductase cytochrome c552 subunit